jgi:hypothetical protein
LIRKTLLERVSLEGICRIFDVSMPWLLEFVNTIIASLPENLNAQVTCPNDEIEIAILEADALWSYVGNKKNQQWLWLVLHKNTRQILAMHGGARDTKDIREFVDALWRANYGGAALRVDYTENSMYSLERRAKNSGFNS